MALSNWDTLAIDKDGKPCDGSMTSPAGVHVALYKNHLHIGDEFAWTEQSGFVRPIVMTIEQGTLKYKDVEIFAERGPQDGIYVVVYVEEYGPHRIEAALIGCGVYGFDDHDWVGVKPESRDHLQAWLSRKDSMTDEAARAWIVDGAGYYDAEQFAETYRTLIEGDYIFPKELATLSLSDSIRFNQGDAYFAEHLGFDVPATAAGEAPNATVSELLMRQKTKTRGELDPC